MQNIILAVLGVVMMTIGTYQVSPSIQKYIQAKKVDNLIEKENAVFDAVARYISIKGGVPASAQALADEGYIEQSTIDDNGWGNPITLTVNDDTGILVVNSTIDDPQAKEIYLRSWKHPIKPTNSSGDIVDKVFVIPTEILHGNEDGELSGAIVSATPPDGGKYKYWYDTSSGEAILKLSDGTTWTPVVQSGTGGGLPLATSQNTVTSTASLPTTGVEDGDIRYVYNADTKSVDTYTYYGSSWAKLGNGIGGGGSGVVVAPITPTSVLTNVTTTFVIVGKNLPSKLNFTLTDAGCSAVTIASTESASVSCSVRVKGVKTAVLSDANGTQLVSSTITASTPEYPPNTGTTASSFTGLLATNQTTSYADFDDGYYKKGQARRFVKHSNGTTLDSVTGLMWTTATLQTDGNTHQNGIYTCSNLNAKNTTTPNGFAGYTDWKAPNLSQMQSILNYGRYGQMNFNQWDDATQGYIDQFDYSAVTYWTSTDNPLNTNNAMTVHGQTGLTGQLAKTNGTGRVRCVRDARND